MSPVKKITHFLVSMKLALTLLFVIALLSIIGTILPQGDQVLESNWPNNPLYDFYKTLGLFDMYNSWWFLAILALLIANLSVCVSKRLPTAMRHFLKPRVDVKDIFITNQPVGHTIPGAGQAGFEAAKKVIAGHRYHIREGKTGSVLAEKGRFTPIASLAFHLSFLFIAIGSIVVGIFGFDERLEIPDGKTAVVPNTGMQVKNNGFNVDYTEVKENGRVTGYRPSVYSSDLEVFENGQTVAQKVITVNDPLRYSSSNWLVSLLISNKINFHQASYYQTSRGYVTVLQINQAPGKALVYLGFAFMMGGICFTLYFPHRRIWLKTGKSGDLLIGGRTNRSKVTFKKDFDHMMSQLRLSVGKEAKADG